MQPAKACNRVWNELLAVAKAMLRNCHVESFAWHVQ
jgi:hypothetical protein